MNTQLHYNYYNYIITSSDENVFFAFHAQKVFWVVARVVTMQVHPRIFWSLDMIWVNLWDFFHSFIVHQAKI